MSRKVFDKISVIIPLYGKFNSERIEMSIESLKIQKKVNLEISVVEQSNNPTLFHIKNIKYLHTKPVFSEDGFLIPGLVRNLAAKNSTGNFIYNSDGDIVFGDRNYFNELLQLMEKDEEICLYHPLMRRIAIDNFDGFRKRFEKKGIQKAILELNLSQPYGATYDDNLVEFRHFEKIINGELEISVATQQDHEAYHAGNNKGKEPFFYTLHMHAGSVMTRRLHFEKVGGYCEKFAGWGCHDVDLQNKLDRLFDLQKIHEISKLEVFHLDHPREYFTNSRWEKNKTLLTERQTLPIEDIIKCDRENYHEKRA
jgi:hypothetical protein